MAGHTYWYALVAFLWFVGMAHAQTADEVAKLIERLVELDSIDVCKYGVKYRAGLEPSLAGVDCICGSGSGHREPTERNKSAHPSTSWIV